MPKSSMARRAPSSLSSLQDGQDVLAVVHQDALGHLQDQRRRAAGRSPPGPWPTSSTTSGDWSWRPDRLMLRVSGRSRGGLVRCHSAACRQASRSTQAPSGRISPLASARGMNSVGGTSPRTGWCQRARASAPTIWPEPRSKVGWYWRNSSPASRARRRSALELHPLDQLGVHLGVVALVAALAGRLGPVHGQVGVAQQLVGAVDVALHPGDAHAAPDVQLAPVDLERLAQPFQHPVGHLDDVDVVAGVLDQHGELVAAEPGHGVAGPHAGVQALGHLDEQPVAGGVAEAVVDLLEAVQVEEQHGHRRRLALGPLEGVVDPVLEQGPVGQRGQRVVEGLVDELVLELAALGDVAGVQDQAADAGVVEQVGDGELDGAPVAVAVAQRQLQLEHAVGPLGHLGQALAQAEPVARSRGSG